MAIFRLSVSLVSVSYTSSILDVNFKKLSSVMSVSFWSPCHMSLDKYKKRLCGPVEFMGQGPFHGENASLHHTSFGSITKFCTQHPHCEYVLCKDRHHILGAGDIKIQYF